ncbi:MAG: PD40 domain-containing protein, partial [Phycisphaerae bacterium]|nr:PD40 domain-containing protein [Phycisphaerae bacterium]
MQRLLVRLALLGLAALTIVAVVGVWWYQRERSIEVYTDADRIRLPALDASPRDILWQPAEVLPGVINQSEDEFEPHLAPDGRSLLFVRGRVGLGTDLYVSERTLGGWTPPRPLSVVNSEADELGPEISRDGMRLYFSSNRGGGHGGYDLWVSVRGDDGWSTPVNLGTGVNSTNHESGPALTPDGRSIYFASDRPRPASPADGPPTPGPGPTRASAQTGFDLYAGVVTPTGITSVRRVDELCSSAHETAPAVSPAGDFVYFASDRVGGAGGFDLYRSRRIDGVHQRPEPLGDGVNSAADEMDPAVALGGFQLHFTSNRTPDDAGPGDLDLYQSTSREVFADRDVHRARVSWQELLPLALWIAMLLIALILLWLLAHAFRSQLFRQLSLIARCLLASLLVHACVLFLMTFWGVGTSLTNWLQDGGGMQVRIASPTLGSVASQVRGSVTDITVEASAETLSRAEAIPADAPTATLATVAAARAEITRTPTPAATADARDAPSRPHAPADSSTDTPAAASEPTVTLRTPAAPAPTRTAEAATTVTATAAPTRPRTEAASAASPAAASP